MAAPPIEPTEPMARPLPISYSSGLTRPLKTAEEVARDIVHDIVSAGLRSGDKLPPEALMLQQYGVSRQSLREGLRLLEVQGLISLRRGPGGGPIVGVVDAANFGRVSTLYYHLIGVSHSELMDAWAWSEGQLAALAAEHPDRDAVRDALTTYLERDAPPIGDLERDEFVEKHSLFHYVVGRHCGNRALELSLTSYGIIVSHHLLRELDPRAFGESIAHDHREIAKAVIAGKAATARLLAARHVRRIENAYRRAVKTPIDELVEWR
jgi:DNA-binding FadR family transcriptional regulator